MECFSKSLFKLFLNEYIPKEFRIFLNKNNLFQDKAVIKILEDDFLSYEKRNPAISGYADFMFNIFDPFFAVICYRLSHYLWSNSEKFQNARMFAYKLHQFARSSTGVDIHPAARIGERFVLDHASGTVIGSTSRIGNDCYILNGVILGSTGIADNPASIRHPYIGNNVQIGAFARVLGNIRIGNNVFIGPLCCVTKDVPDNLFLKAFMNDSQKLIES